MRGERIGAGMDGWRRGRLARVAVALLSTGALAATPIQTSTGPTVSPDVLLSARTEVPPAERAGLATGRITSASALREVDAGEDGEAGDADRRRGAFSASGTPFAWRAIHDRVDGTLWRDVLSASAGRQDEPRSEPSDTASNGSPPTGRLPGTFHGIGFPALERVVRLPEERRREWTPLIAWSEPAGPGGSARVPLPHVRCMGLSPAGVARRAARVESDVLSLSIEHGVSASLVKALIAAESCFDPEAISSVGAIGLMQLMPATADWLGAGDPADVLDNLDGGIRYLASLQERFGDTELALAAYNAGPGNVRRHGGVPPFAETRAYVRKVMAFHRRYVAATRLAARPDPVRSKAAPSEATRADEAR